jgi:hypothetical protein
MPPTPRKPKGAKPDPLHEVIVEKLYTVSEDKFKSEYLEGVTAIVNLSGDVSLVPDSERFICLTWNTQDNVVECQFEAAVRFCSSVMKGKAQRVLLVGHQDTVDTVATCVLREFMGCSAQEALNVIRQHRPTCMTKSELVETVFRYSPS